MKIPFEMHTERQEPSCEVEQPQVKAQKKSHFFSALSARVFFLLLLMGDLLWLCYALILLLVSSVGALLTLFKGALFAELQQNALLTLKRALVCAIALLVAVFAPSFGIMIACSYFLMYDRGGIEEVVPSSLQSQFKEFFQDRDNDNSCSK